MAKLSKRTIAYILDVLLITAILGLIFNFLPKTNRAKELETQLDSMSQNMATNEMSKMDFFLEFSRLQKQLDQETEIKIAINAVVIVIYFIIIPYFTHGFTLGKKVMKIQIVSDSDRPVTFMALFIRAFLINGLAYLLLLTLALFLIPSQFYLSFVTILAIFQILTLIISAFMVEYKRNCLALQDILSHSRVINDKRGEL